MLGSISGGSRHKQFLGPLTPGYLVRRRWAAKMCNTIFMHPSPQNAVIPAQAGIQTKDANPVG